MTTLAMTTKYPLGLLLVTTILLLVPTTIAQDPASECAAVNCAACIDNDPYLCYNCEEGYYIDMGTCKSCGYCSDCVTKDVDCSSCRNNYYYDFQERTCHSRYDCSDGKYADKNTMKCEGCDSACKKCKGPSKIECTSCDEFHFVDSGMCKPCISPCVECTSRSTCKRCTDGQAAKSSKCVDDCGKYY